MATLPEPADTDWPDTDTLVTARHLDSESLRRCAHRIRTQSDVIAEALQRDAKGEISVEQAPECIFGVMAELTKIYHDLMSLHRMADAARRAAGERGES